MKEVRLVADSYRSERASFPGYRFSEGMADSTRERLTAQEKTTCA